MKIQYCSIIHKNKYKTNESGVYAYNVSMLKHPQSALLATSPMPQTSKILFRLVSFCKTLFGLIRKMSEYWSSY